MLFSKRAKKTVQCWLYNCYSLYLKPFFSKKYVSASCYSSSVAHCYKLSWEDYNQQFLSELYSLESAFTNTPKDKKLINNIINNIVDIVNNDDIINNELSYLDQEIFEEL
ncbi:MAG: hypothetical protein QXO21_00005 [Candidatus Anstonellales archaeon]